MKIKLTLIALFMAISGLIQAQELMNYTEIQALLPDEVNGFKGDGDKDGSTMKMEGMNFSQASWTYLKGNKSMDVMIFDYTGSESMYNQAFGIYQSGMEYESDDEVVKSIQYEGNPGWYSYQKKDNDASYVFSINERFIVMVDGENIDSISEIEDFIDQLPLEKLK